MRKLIFFHASWCPPCRFYEKQFIAPLEEKVGAEHIERIDAWKEPLRAEKYHVERLPTVVLLDGEKVFTALISPMVPMEIMSSTEVVGLSNFLAM